MMADMVRICHVEELSLLPRWLELVVGYHCSDSFHEPSKYPIEIELRRKVQGFEVDMVVTCRSGKRVNRIGFELKKSDWAKAIKQAMERRALFHYFYIVLDMYSFSILGMLRSHREALEYGIGFVSARDNCIVIKSYTKANWRESRSYAYTILPYLNTNNEGIESHD